MNEKRLHEPILPMIGLGGIRLGTEQAMVEAELGPPLRRKLGRDPKDRLEWWDYKGFFIDFKAGIVWSLAAEEGYLGATPSGVKVGFSWAQLKQIHPDLDFHEDAMVWYVPGIDGLSFDIVRPPGPGDVNPSSKWIDEWYEVMNPWQAFVISIEVHSIRYGNAKAEL